MSTERNEKQMTKERKIMKRKMFIDTAKNK